MKKKDKENLDFIRNKFDEGQLEAPDKLSESRIRNLLNAKMNKNIRNINENAENENAENENAENEKIVKFKPKKRLKAAVSLAACFAIIITALAVTHPWKTENVIDNPSKTASDNDENQVRTFKNYSEIKALINGLDIWRNAVKTVDENTLESADSSSSSFAQTYKQVESVDEADIIKNDGKYIYFLSQETGVLSIFSVNEEKTKLISQIDKFSYISDGNETNNEFIYDIFVKGNRLVLNSDRWSEKNQEVRTAVYIYDITNIKKPKQISETEQSGEYLSSRIIGDDVYVVSNYIPMAQWLKKAEDYIPMATAESGAFEKIEAQDICTVDNPERASYIVISRVNIETGGKSSKTKAIFGCGEDIYCNESNMYAIVSDYSNYAKREIEIASDILIAPSESQIIKISLSKGITFEASCKVKGYINNQFSLDEKDGFLRVAATSVNKNGSEVNNLFVFDKNLKQIGKVADFAENESIKAVRFVGNTAYVITFEETDPLFIIDLSNPKAPQIKGSVKISGFSSQLIPVDENTLLGIGHSVEENENGGISVSGLKLALFDIGDSENPKVLDSKEYPRANSQATNNHKAIVFNNDMGYYAIPYDLQNYNMQNNKLWVDCGIITFEVNSDKIEVTNEFIKENYEYTPLMRSTYVGNYLYAVEEYNNTVTVNAFKMD